MNRTMEPQSDPAYGHRSPPTLEILPAQPISGFTDISCTVDPPKYAERKDRAVVWRRDGEELPGGLIKGGNLRQGEVWSCAVLDKDGEELVSSDPVTVPGPYTTVLTVVSGRQSCRPA